LGDGFKENVLKMEILCSILMKFLDILRAIDICPHFMDDHRQIHQNSSLKVKFIDQTINSTRKNALKG